MTGRMSARGMGAVGLLLVLLAGCGDAGSEAADLEPPEAAASALCDAVAAEDIAGMERAFALGHDGLHELARILPVADERALAGDLLEAKQRAEALISDGDPAADELRAALETLAARTDAGFVALGRDVPTC
jgi:hypothetical protein